MLLYKKIRKKLCALGWHAWKNQCLKENCPIICPCKECEYNSYKCKYCKKEKEGTEGN